MQKLKIAILEDNKILLNNFKRNLEEHDLATVVVAERASEIFIEKVSTQNPDALFLDIDLNGDSMNGLDVAYHLKLPVLFVSGHNDKKIKEIEQLERDCSIYVKHISKPFSDEVFIITARAFLEQVREDATSKYITLDFAESKRNKILVDSIVYLGTEKANGAESNNKAIYFTNRKPEVLIDFTIAKMHEKGFSNQKFLEIIRGVVVNIKHIKSRKKGSREIEVEVMNDHGKIETKLLKTSENFRMP